MGSEKACAAFVICLILCVITVIFCLGAFVGVSHERSQAIKAKAAHWAINPSTGERSFVYGAKP